MSKLQRRQSKDIKVKGPIAMDNWSAQISGDTSVLTWQHQCQPSWEHCFQALVKAPEKDKIKNLKLVLLLPSLPNKVSKLEIQVDAIYQRLSLHKFLYPLSHVHCYRILYFVLLFSSVGDQNIQTLHWSLKVRSLKRANQPWNMRAMICSFSFWPDEYKAFFFLTRRYLKISTHTHT